MNSHQYVTHYDTTFCTPVKLQEIVCFFQPDSATSHTKNNPLHTLQGVLVNGIINGGFLPPTAPDLVLCV